jgi:hypothetical protein
MTDFVGFILGVRSAYETYELEAIDDTSDLRSELYFIFLNGSEATCFT